jgi:hypothetical protein
MSKADSFRLRARECTRTAFPLAMAALSLLFLLVSTDISRLVQALQTAAYAKTHATVCLLKACEKVVVHGLRRKYNGCRRKQGTGIPLQDIWQSLRWRRPQRMLRGTYRQFLPELQSVL